MYFQFSCHVAYSTLNESDQHFLVLVVVIMGKASKKKRSKRSCSGGGRSGSQNQAPPSPSPSSTSGILGRVRHGDPRIRLGALSALSATSLSADALSSLSFSTPSVEVPKIGRVSDELLQAVSERVLDADLPVAQTAAGCLSNYAQFAAELEADTSTNSNSSSRSDDNTSGGRSPAILGGMVDVLLSRVERGCNDLRRIGMQLASVSTSNSAPGSVSDSAVPPAENKTTKMSKKKLAASTASHSAANNERVHQLLTQQLEMIRICLVSLSGLIERSPVVLERLSGHNGQGYSQLIDVLGSVLTLSAECLAASKSRNVESRTSSTAANTSMTTAGALGTFAATPLLPASVHEAASSAASAAAQTIHSTLDENVFLLQMLICQTSPSMSSTTLDVPPASSNASNSKQDLNLLQVLVATVQSGSMPALARLHTAGALVTARHLLPRLESTSPISLTNLDSFVISSVLPLIQQHLVYHATVASALQRRIASTQQEYEMERNDERMERDIVRKVDQRKESARSIARRQKSQKDKEKEKTKNKNNDDEEESGEERCGEEMQVAENGERKKGTTKEILATSKTEAHQNDETGLNEDKGEEPEANSNIIESAEDLYDRAVSAWKASCLSLKLAVEVTANLFAGSGDNDSGSALNTMSYCDDYDMELAEESAAEETQRRDAPLFAEVVRLSIPDRVVGVIRVIVNTELCSTLPEVVDEDLTEIVTKCGICICNAACNVTVWAEEQDASSKLWSELVSLGQRDILEGKRNGFRVACKTSVVSIMLSLLRTRASLVTAVGERDLQMILSLLDLQGDRYCETRRDAVAILGILCSAPHADQVNALICDAFLKALSRDNERASVLSELLNVMMDIYSADESDDGNHETIFKQKKVLLIFQKILPNFQRQLSLERSLVNCSEVEMWEETALNASRFIRYKNDTLAS